MHYVMMVNSGRICVGCQFPCPGARGDVLTMRLQNRGTGGAKVIRSKVAVDTSIFYILEYNNNNSSNNNNNNSSTNN